MESDPTLPLDLERWNLITGSDPEVMRDIAILFIEDTANRLVLLSAAIARRDTPEIRILAHSIKGAAANIGAQACSHLAECIETKAKTREEQESQASGNRIYYPLMAAIRAAFSQTKTSLAPYTASGTESHALHSA